MKYYLNNRDNRANLAANDFDEFFRPFWSMGEFSPKTDIREKDGSVIIETDMPGFDKNDISVELSEGYLTVSAKRDESKESEEKGRFIRRERRSGSFSRSFYVGSGVEETDISASYENGTLKVTFPTEAQARKDSARSIEIK